MERHYNKPGESSSHNNNGMHYVLFTFGDGSGKFVPINVQLFEVQKSVDALRKRATQ